MNKNKIIGIPGWKSPDGDFFGAGINHLQFISKYGYARILMPWEKKVKIDLLYLPGGLDISPETYGEVPEFRTSNVDVMKDFFYRQRLVDYITKVPVFGVCLGMQTLGVYFGSKLQQDLLVHEQSDDRWETAHYVWGLTSKSKFKVNSHHHQAILRSQLAKDLEPLYVTDCVGEPGVDDNDVIVEAFRHKELPIVGVQWHPEELYDRFSQRVMERFIAGEPI